LISNFATKIEYKLENFLQIQELYFLFFNKRKIFVLKNKQEYIFA